MFYDNFRLVCKEKGTTVTAVLKKLGKSTGSTGKWRNGSYPTLDVVMAMAEDLGVTLDKLVYNREPVPSFPTGTQLDPEWIEIITHIPEDKQQICKDFLRTHMVIPEKFQDENAG